jgi:pilus assembly protein CpaB
LFKLIRNKIFIGSMCLLLAGVFAFLLLPKLYKVQASTVDIVKLKQNVDYGTTITDEMLTIAEVGAYGLADNIIKNKSEIVGLVAGSTIYAGEYLWRDRFMTLDAYVKAASKDELTLSDGTYLLTISLPSASAGIAGVLRAGDIVDVYGCSGDNESNTVNEALTEVKVHEVLNSKLLSLNDLDDKLKANPNANPSDYDFIPAYVVFIVNMQQAETLIGLEKDKSLHLTLRKAGV